jgi:ribonuclease BN (tRNA processing enzyme)
MRVLILGVSDAFTRRGFGSSALIETAGRYVLLDCPDPIHRVLREATARAGWSVDVSRIDDILLTHLHGDHCNGLESFGFARMIGRSRNPGASVPRIFTNRPASERLWERLAPAMEHQAWLDRPARLEDYFDLRPLDPGPEVKVSGLRVRCRMTEHPVPTSGFLISDGTWTLGWSGDTPFERAHVDWLDEADLIVHESARGPVHTPIDALNALPPSIRARLRLVHLPDDFDASLTDIRPLRAGEVLTGAERGDGDREVG